MAARRPGGGADQAVATSPAAPLVRPTSRAVSPTDAARVARFRAAERRLGVASRLLDDLVTLPGGARFGLEPILGLIPVLGDVVGGAAGFWLIAEAARFGVPRVVLLRMLVNTLLDLGVGLIPLIGDLFDFAYKSNAKNLALFRRHALEPGASTTGSKAFLAGLLLVFIGVVWLIVLAVGWLVSLVIQELSTIIGN